MKKCSAAVGLALMLTFVSPFAASASATRTGTIGNLWVDSHLRAGSQDVVWLYLAGAWAGTTCGADCVWFNADEDSHLLATVLSVRAMGGQLTITVDDTLPKASAYCHVSSISTAP